MYILLDKEFPAPYILLLDKLNDTLGKMGVKKSRVCPRSFWIPLSPLKVKDSLENYNESY